MDADGKNTNCLTKGSFHNFNPSWSPDAKAIIFESDRDGDDADELFQIGADGRGEVLIKRADANLVFPAYSSDGTQISYGAVKNRNVDSYIAKASGKDERLFKTHAGSVRWSKTGKLIAYIAYDDKKLREIFVSKPDGSDERAITHLNHP